MLTIAEQMQKEFEIENGFDLIGMQNKLAFNSVYHEKGYSWNSGYTGFHQVRKNAIDKI